MDETLLAVDDLAVEFSGRSGRTRAVDGLSLTIARAETLAVVGESGCGKSVTALSVLRLLQEPAGRIVGGTVRFHGRDLASLDESEMRQIRGRSISMIFQEPMTSLNPVLTIGEQIGETIRIEGDHTAEVVRQRALAMLDMVQIPDSARRLKQYPHELSGGMRQRVMIAMALVNRPDLLIADEPTTALDVTIQAQVLDLMRGLSGQLGMATLLITHDFGVVAEMASRVIVMYAGRKVEEGPVRSLLSSPRHPYTIGLLGSVPKWQQSAGGERRRRLVEIPGAVPALRGPAQACSFAPRCPIASDRCHAEVPPPTAVAPGHVAACWHWPSSTNLRSGWHP
ncbi:MAG: ABC transporter ATP-binding protein [Alphaproteobacteria bacterium]|nr:ABC transporter ATP-binding protein [Alphaproteobacteria bacterium]